MRARLLPALCCLVLAACGSDQAGQASGVGKLDAEGRWIVVNYWATWCHPCRTEIPEINQFAANNASSVSVYAVNFDNVRGEELQRQAADMGITFTLLEEDPANTLGYARPTVLPTTVVIDPTGQLVARLLGTQTEASLQQALNQE
jgi:thiol-disulfide isomerase/thioredoxin